MKSGDDTGSIDWYRHPPNAKQAINNQRGTGMGTRAIVSCSLLGTWAMMRVKKELNPAHRLRATQLNPCKSKTTHAKLTQASLEKPPAAAAMTPHMKTSDSQSKGIMIYSRIEATG
jgi:hypothetical protein